MSSNNRGYKRKRYTYPNSRKRSNTFMMKKTSAGIKKFVKRSYGNPMSNNSEMKYYTCQRNHESVANLIAATSWQYTGLKPNDLGCITAPPPGSSYDQRVGRKIIGKRLYIRMNLDTPRAYSNLSRDPVIVRVVIALDTQTNGTQALGSDILSTPTADGNSQINALQNPRYFGRFKILYDKIHTLQDQQMAFGYTDSKFHFSSKQKCFSISIDLKDLVINFNPDITDNKITSVVDNSVSIYVGHVGGPQSGTPLCSYISRLYFKDP